MWERSGSMRLWPRRNQRDPSELNAGDDHYRAYVGPPRKFDVVSAAQFNVLTEHGLREQHFLLDVGCGSLRAGRLFIVYLLAGRYFGVDPNRRLVREGLRLEVGRDMARRKGPTFRYESDFSLTRFGRRFDFVLAHSIFSHASPDQIRRCLAQVRDVLRPRGRFVATYVKGDTDYDGGEWVYPGVVRYRAETISAMAEECGLQVEELDRAHPNQQTWMILRLTDAPTR